MEETILMFLCILSIKPSTSSSSSPASTLPSDAPGFKPCVPIEVSCSSSLGVEGPARKRASWAVGESTSSKSIVVEMGEEVGDLLIDLLLVGVVY